MSKSKKLSLIIVSALVFSYLFGFVFVTPLMLSASTPVKGLAQSIYYNAYQQPINKLSNGNYIKKCWRSLNLYWCRKDSECEVK